MIWALIGASTIAGQYMIGAIREGGGGDVRWVISNSHERAAGFARDHAIPNFGTDLGEALADPAVDAVYISSTNEKHHAQAMAAIAAGKHVLCEKPLAMSRADATEMVAAAKAAGVTFATNHHLRSAGSHQAIRELIASGGIGRVLSMRVFHAVLLPEHLRGWRLDDPNAGGGVIADLTVHNADTVRHILGEDPLSVTAEMAVSGLGRGVEDSAMSVWMMPSGAMVFSHESFTHPFTDSGIEVHGTEGSILARGIMAQDPVGHIDLVTAEGRVPVSFETHGLYEAGVAAFVKAVTTGKAPAVTGLDGLKSMIVADAVRTAAITGTRQVIDYGAAL